VDVTGVRESNNKVCPFSLNERETRNCITINCMAWQAWLGDRGAGVCLLIGDAPWSNKVTPKGENGMRGS